MLVGIIRRALEKVAGRRVKPKPPRIPLDQAEHIFATFGITRPTWAYERWVKPDGFDLENIGDVLHDSPFIIIHDWRSPLEHTLEDVVDALQRLGVALEVELRNDLVELGGAAAVSCGKGPQVVVKYGPADDEFDLVIRGIQSVIPVDLEFRACPYNYGNDTWKYAILPRDEWADLEQRSPGTIGHFYQLLPPE